MVRRNSSCCSGRSYTTLRFPLSSRTTNRHYREAGVGPTVLGFPGGMLGPHGRMVKKVMRPPCGITSGGRPVALCSAPCHRGNPPVVQLPERAEHFLYLDGFFLDGGARRTPLPLSSVKTRRTESTSTRIRLAIRRASPWLALAF